MLKRLSAILIPSLIAVAIIGYMLYSVWDNLLTAIQNAIPSYLIAAIAICIGAWFIRGWRYKYILEKLEIQISLMLSTACIYVSQTANLIIPARLGDLVRLFIQKHEVNASYSKGLSSIVIERFFDIATVAILGVVTIPFILNVPEWFSTVLMIVLLACGGFIVFLVICGKIKSKNKYITMGLKLFDDVKKASLTITALLVLGVVSVVIWLTDSIICWIIALMFQQQIPILIVILAIVIGNLVKAVPITPGGMGTYEAAVAITLQLGGVEPVTAVLIAIIDHLVKNLVTLVGGVISLYMFGDWAVELMKKAFSRGLDKGEII
ncbi:lysylphosphatidylglycerol synthase transmembrane domain-containing protein [Methanolacinia petrolearia]|uniref:lysylphosphatidylglycerol synthase transmembrane domain-containing protein n=1 Tax=Methanolacinia petrolearia TaxID=54120 RepID=UPI003BAAA42B